MADNFYFPADTAAAFFAAVAEGHDPDGGGGSDQIISYDGSAGLVADDTFLLADPALQLGLGLHPTTSTAPDVTALQLLAPDAILQQQQQLLFAQQQQQQQQPLSYYAASTEHAISSLFQAAAAPSALMAPDIFVPRASRASRTAVSYAEFSEDEFSDGGYKSDGHQRTHSGNSVGFDNNTNFAIIPPFQHTNPEGFPAITTAAISPTPTAVPSVITTSSTSTTTSASGRKRRRSRTDSSWTAPSRKPRAMQARPDFVNDKPVMLNPSKDVYWYVQAKNCQSLNVSIRRCRACTRRKSGVGACRFIGVRAFMEDVSPATYDTIDPPYAFVDHVAGRGPTSAYTLASLEQSPSLEDDLAYVADHVAQPLLTVLDQELELEKEGASKGNLLRIVPKDKEAYRSLCDICSTSLFAGRYMCYFCGLEMCADCRSDWIALGDDPNTKLVRNSVRFAFEFCAYGNRHSPDSMIPVSRFLPGQLAGLRETVAAHVVANPHPSARLSDNLLARITPRTTQAASLAANPDAAGKHTPVHFPVDTYMDGELSLPQFRARWQEGTPMVVRGVGRHLTQDWSPIGFIQRSGNDKCSLVDENGEFIEATVFDFFEGFAGATYKGRPASLRLKDWPTNGDFKDMFPGLFYDFERALPFAECTHRDGLFNLASMFPKEFNAPDLGPKMYNAYPASHAAHGGGSTTLHLDVTDAVNIMTYALPNGTPEALDNVPGAAPGMPVVGALWDIFRAEDSGKIRKFLLERELEDPVLYHNPMLKRERNKSGSGSLSGPASTSPTAKDAAGGTTTNTTSSSSLPSPPSSAATTATATGFSSTTDDPIHRQFFYLTDPELKLLRERYGVLPYRIWQKPGDAVFIPAGCAHQVCNLSSCVKAAIDFVSPENLNRCLGLIGETRALARVKKKEDVLQLKQILFFSWLTAMLEHRKKAAESNDLSDTASAEPESVKPADDIGINVTGSENIPPVSGFFDAAAFGLKAEDDEIVSRLL
ncbi:uncharacterized protein V1518DRAFT_417990 [Limtongia smithiae]|uniref:uncharacterized protein n=1 Tax=Limtongia smithiae TaxID=1125753 RepID=UPI0034CEB6DC